MFGRFVAVASSIALFASFSSRPSAFAPLHSPGARLQPTAAAAPDPALLARYCIGCHSTRTKSGNFVLEGLDPARAGQDPEQWERVVRKLRAGLMPPAGQPRPDEASYSRFLSALQAQLDLAAAQRPDPGRTEIVHRLNRLEYVSAVRDVLAVDINASDLLPADDSSYGFDNMAGVLKMSSALMERYLAAAKVVSRLAIGSPPPAETTAIYRVSPETQQHDQQEGLPFGTRGGTLIRHVFPLDADYDIKIGVAGNRAAGQPQELEVMLDGARVKLFTLEPRVQPELTLRIAGGPHELGVTFLRSALDLIEQVREPFQNPDAPSGTGGPLGAVAGVGSVTIAGPHNAAGPGDTPSRRRVLVCTPSSPAQEARCAKTIVSTVARRAYRGLVTPESVQVLLDFYQKGRAHGETFEDGIEFAIRRLLVSPEFLYRIEADPDARSSTPAAASKVAAATSRAYRISDLELASRLSFFLWSSVPDDELLDAAERGMLRTPAVLEKQVRRMLGDARSETLMRNFGGQWLLTRNLATVRPGETYALAFDETLRQSMQRETELFLDSIMRENRGVLELLDADYTFLNERLALHYGIPHVQGSHFRRVPLPADSPRRGLLGQGSVLTVTSPAIRTSPVIRGKWILNNIIGVPPPDPPPNVPALSDQKTQARIQTMRERMSRHRANPACATCHNMIDPAGFALENFDAIGRWRTVDESFNAIDSTGTLPDGTAFRGVVELRTALTSHPDRFVHTVTEKLLTYALGRGLEYYDMPAVRKILKEAAPGGYKMQAIILGIVESYPFQFRRDDGPARPLGASVAQQ